MMLPRLYSILLLLYIHTLRNKTIFVYFYGIELDESNIYLYIYINICIYKALHVGWSRDSTTWSIHYII